MALLRIEDELARAQLREPFSSLEQGQAWTNLWCSECANASFCSLLLVSAMGRVPAAWIEREPAAPNRYTCTEYRDIEEPLQVTG